MNLIIKLYNWMKKGTHILQRCCIVLIYASVAFWQLRMILIVIEVTRKRRRLIVKHISKSSSYDSRNGNFMIVHLVVVKESQIYLFLISICIILMVFVSSSLRKECYSDMCFSYEHFLDMLLVFSITWFWLLNMV